MGREKMKERASKYAKEYRDEQERLVSMRRQAKKTGGFFVEPEAKMMMVVHISGINKMAPKPRKIMKLLRLDQLHKAVFVKCTKPMMNMLKCIRPYVAYGYPNPKTVKMLILKKGFGRVGVDDKPVPLSSNDVISENLGQFGIDGVDDLVHELYTVGPHYKQASNFLRAFKLSSPCGGYVLKKHGFNEPKGGDWGNREELINELVRRM